MGKMDIIKELKERVEAKGIGLPDRFEYMKVDDQIQTLRELDESSETAGTPPADRGVEAPVMKAPEMEVVLEAIKQLQKDLRKKDADIEALEKKLDAAAANRPAGDTTFQYSEPYVRMMKEIMRGDVNKHGLTPMEYANDDDRTDPVTFFGRKANIRIRVIEVGGQLLAPPNNHEVVRFNNLFWFVDPAHGTYDIRCEYTTSSKLMIEYLRKAPKYRVEYFEDVKEAAVISENSRWADYRDQHLQMLRGRPQHEVTKMAIDMNLAIASATEFHQVCKLVAERLADDQMASEKAAEANLRKQADPAALIVPKHATV